MTRRATGPSRWILAALAALVVSACGAHDAASHTASASATGVRMTEIAHGLDHPWAVALLDDGSFLVTERIGRLRRIGNDGKLSAPITGVPAVWAHGQAGLLDLEPAPDFARSHRVYFSYVEPGDGDTAGTAAAMSTLDSGVLRDLKVVYRETPKRPGTANFGSRIAFDRNGHVFISQGDRFQNLLAQRLDVPEGKLMRLALDGSVPADNPFVARKNALPMIWSYGHRNIQGLAIDPASGRLWASEHGPRGGDELNRPARGRNYGWPIASNGMDYSTNRPYPETVGTSAPGMESPDYVWKKSPGLSGMAFLRGHPESAWNNSLFLGALADRNLIRLTLDGDRIVGEERLLGDLGARIRDVRVGKDGSVYVLTDDDNGRLLRLQPPAVAH
jgi:aldose sugar dehydrogenase